MFSLGLIERLQREVCEIRRLSSVGTGANGVVIPSLLEMDLD